MSYYPYLFLYQSSKLQNFDGAQVLLLDPAPDHIGFAISKSGAAFLTCLFASPP